MITKVDALELDRNEIALKEQEILEKNDHLRHTDTMEIIESLVFPKFNIHYTDKFQDFCHKVDENSDEFIYIVRYHDQDKYPHYLHDSWIDSEQEHRYSEIRELEKKGLIFPIEQAVDQILIFHFKNQQTDAYLFPLHAPRPLDEDENIRETWSRWDRKFEVKENVIKHKVTAHFWDSMDYNDHTNLYRSSGYDYNFGAKELTYYF